MFRADVPGPPAATFACSGDESRQGPLPHPIRPGKLGAVLAVLTDPWRKSLVRILRESVAAAAANRTLPRFYFKHLLYRRDVENWRHYLTDREERRIQASIKDAVRRPFLSSKLLFHQHFRVPGIELPVFIGYNVGPAFVWQGRPRRVTSARDLATLIDEIASQPRLAGIFAKPVGGIHGKGCCMVGGPSAGAEQTERNFQDLCAGSFVFEEALVQHPSLSAIYPNSVNTLRVITYMPRDGVSLLVSTLLRLGAGGRCVDNASSGGVFVKVDARSGALLPYARKFHEFGGTVHFVHPDTGVKFSGCTVPHFPAAVSMALAASDYLGYRIVGWDLTITENGPVLIEGNHNPHLFGAEIADGGYKRNPTFATFLREAGLA